MIAAMERRLAPLAGPTHAILRVGTALLFMQHGAMKLFGAFGGVDGQGGTVELMSRYGLAGVIEFFLSLFIVVGFLTRPIAALMFVEMLAAYWIAHMPQGGFPVQNGGEPALLFALVWLFLLGNGAGPFSVDASLRDRRLTADG